MKTNIFHSLLLLLWLWYRNTRVWRKMLVPYINMFIFIFLVRECLYKLINEFSLLFSIYTKTKWAKTNGAFIYVCVWCNSANYCINTYSQLWLLELFSGGKHMFLRSFYIFLCIKCRLFCFCFVSLRLCNCSVNFSCIPLYSMCIFYIDGYGRKTHPI